MENFRDEFLQLVEKYNINHYVFSGINDDGKGWTLSEGQGNIVANCLVSTYLETPYFREVTERSLAVHDAVLKYQGSLDIH